MNKNKIRNAVALLSLFIILFAVIPACNETEEQNTTVNTEELTTLNLNIEGMTCTGCEKTITNAIMELDGINHAKLSHIEANAVVEFDQTKTCKEEIIKAINNSGYKVVGKMDL